MTPISKNIHLISAWHQEFINIIIECHARFLATILSDAHARIGNIFVFESECVVRVFCQYTSVGLHNTRIDGTLARFGSNVARYGK